MIIRNTKQRQLIQQVLNDADRPLSVDEIFAAAKTKKNSLGIATVYRNVKTLMEEGLLAAIELPGESSRFELAGKGHHHHFRCDSRGRVYETKACLENLRRLVPRNFELRGHDLLLYGRCSECR